MTVDELKAKIETNYSILRIEEEYKRYLDRHNNIPNLGFFNRFLTHLQNALATDIKPETIWNIYGRKLKDEHSLIYILVPQYKVGYIYAESGEKLKQNELTNEELSKAIQIGYVQKHSEIIGYNVSVLIDIRDTVCIPGEQDTYNNDLPKAKLSKLLTTCANYKSKKELKEILESAQTSQEKLLALIGIYLDAEIAADRFNEMREFIKESVVYSVFSYCGIKADIHFEFLDELIQKSEQDEKYKLHLFDAFEQIEELTYHILGILGFEGDKNDFGDDIYTQIHTIKKSDKLLSILESTEVRMKYSARLKAENS